MSHLQNQKYIFFIPNSLIIKSVILNQLEECFPYRKTVPLTPINKKGLIRMKPEKKTNIFGFYFEGYVETNLIPSFTDEAIILRINKRNTIHFITTRLELDVFFLSEFAIIVTFQVLKISKISDIFIHLY